MHIGLEGTVDSEKQQWQQLTTTEEEKRTITNKTVLVATCKDVSKIPVECLGIWITIVQLDCKLKSLEVYVFVYTSRVACKL